MPYPGHVEPFSLVHTSTTRRLRWRSVWLWPLRRGLHALWYDPAVTSWPQAKHGRVVILDHSSPGFRVAVVAAAGLDRRGRCGPGGRSRALPAARAAGDVQG